MSDEMGGSNGIGDEDLEPRSAEARTWPAGFSPEDAANDHDGWNPGLDARDGLDGKNSGLGPQGWRRADAALRDKILEHLFEDRILNAHGIEVQVEEGVVTLSGLTPHASDVRLAEMLTREICPQAEVLNRLHGPAEG